MTLDQLRVFIAVADRQHLTEGARSINLTPSAATAAIQTLEARYHIKLFHRVGRRLELSEGGRVLLNEARLVVQAARSAERALNELNELSRGSLVIASSQTAANYLVPPSLLTFSMSYPGIELSLREGNTSQVSGWVASGEADLGCVEGRVVDDSLCITHLATDKLIIVGSKANPMSNNSEITVETLLTCRWVLRERGSGTRAVFESFIASAGGYPDRLIVDLCVPTNEGACSAILGTQHLTAVSELVARPHIESGRLVKIQCELPPRPFSIITHNHRYRTRAADAFVDVLKNTARALPSITAL